MKNQLLITKTTTTTNYNNNTNISNEITLKKLLRATRGFTTSNNKNQNK